MYRKGVLGDAKLPRENELIPLFILMLRQLVNTPGSPISSWSLSTFGIHAMLLASILETDGIFNQTLDSYELVFNNYFDQIDFATKLAKNEPDTELLSKKSWTQNMMLVTFLKNFGLDVFGKQALWNPLSCAGTTFSYLCLFKPRSRMYID